MYQDVFKDERDEFYIYADGSFCERKKIGGVGVIIYRNNSYVDSISKRIPYDCETNEVCEANAIIEAMKQALNPDILDASIITCIYNDSKFLLPWYQRKLKDGTIFDKPQLQICKGEFYDTQKELMEQFNGNLRMRHFYRKDPKIENTHKRRYKLADKLAWIATQDNINV